VEAISWKVNDLVSREEGGREKAKDVREREEFLVKEASR